jgi:hypothetical protein
MRLDTDQFLSLLRCREGCFPEAYHKGTSLCLSAADEARIEHAQKELSGRKTRPAAVTFVISRQSGFIPSIGSHGNVSGLEYSDLCP